MLDFPETMSPADVDQWCNRGYVLVRTTGALARYLGVDLEALGGMGEEEPGNEYEAECALREIPVKCEEMNRSHTLLTTFASNIQPTWPACGLVNLPPCPDVPVGVAVYLHRAQSRVYTRTMSYSCINLSVPHMRAIEQASRFTFPRVNSHYFRDLCANAAHKAEYPSSLREAIEMLRSPSIASVALNRHVHLTEASDGGVLVHYNTKRVGTLRNWRLAVDNHRLARFVRKFLTGVIFDG